MPYLLYNIFEVYYNIVIYTYKLVYENIYKCTYDVVSLF